MLYQKAEEFIRDIYWSDTHDKENKLNITDVIHEKLVKDNEQKDPEYYEHREGVVHVSSLSKCLRGVVLEMLGAKKDKPADARKLGVFKAGNLFEDFIVDALGDKVLDRQTEYIFKYKGIILTGRDDGTIEHEGVRMVLENKSVHSDSFWYREQEGTLVSWQNQMQIETYLWLRRECPNMFLISNHKDIVYTNLSKEELIAFKKLPDYVSVDEVEKPDNSNLNGIFCYISKDDCTTSFAPVRFNKRIIDEIIIPILDIVNDGYEKRDATVVPSPELVVYEKGRRQWQKNWLCKYCDYHSQCAGAGWILEADAIVRQRNSEQATKMGNPYAVKTKPIIGVDEGLPGGDKTAVAYGEKKPDGTIQIEKVDIINP